MHPRKGRLNPRLEFALRRGGFERAARAVVFGARAEYDLAPLAEAIVIEQDRADHYHALIAGGAKAVARIEAPLAGGGFDRALIFTGKHREQNKALIGRAWFLLKEGGELFFDGEKKEGIDALIRGLRALGLTPQVEAKAHGKIAWVRKRAEEVGAIEAWAKADEQYENADGFLVRPGIFSAARIDAGTRLLLECLSEEALGAPLSGRVADFGGGYGAIAKIVLERFDQIDALDLMEISHLACACARANIKDERANFIWDDVASAPHASYDAIISNPPFHEGRATDGLLAREFIAAAARALKPDGRFYMVALRHLGFEKFLAACFGKVEIMAEAPAFKVFVAKEPRTLTR